MVLNPAEKQAVGFGYISVWWQNYISSYHAAKLGQCYCSVYCVDWFGRHRPLVVG